MREDRLRSIVEKISDYRLGEIEKRTPESVEDWVRQFPDTVQDPLLAALDHVLGKTYLSRDDFRNFLKGLVMTSKLSADRDPQDYWRRANVLDIQQGGSSQREIRRMFGEVLQEKHGFDVDDTGGPDGDFIYLDDCIGTGSRLRNDVCDWLGHEAPPKINLHVVTPILYAGSRWVDKKIQETAKENGKVIKVRKWCFKNFRLENRLSYKNRSDVLWPTSIPKHEAVQEYCKRLTDRNHPPKLRKPGHQGAFGLFQDDAQKIFVEEAFLVRGCEILREQRNLPVTFRPLGYSNLDTLGFGSMFVTYRNCPNNCPLALWVDQESCPALLPRKTNTMTYAEGLYSE